MLKRFAAFCLMLALLLCGALAEAPEGGDPILHAAGGVSEFVTGDALDEAHKSGAGEAQVGTDIYLCVDPYTASYLTFAAVTETGRPLPGVAIFLTYGGVTEFYGMTDENGLFSTYVFRGTPYEVTLEKSGYRTEKFSFTALEETGTVTVVMREYHRFDLIVLENGTPVEGLRVVFSYNGGEMRTDKNGAVSFRPVAGTYDAQISLPDGTVKTVRVHIGEDTLYVVDIGTQDWPEQMPADVLGAGGGLSDLFIVFDQEYRPEDYALTAQLYADGEIAAQMDADAMDEEEMAALTAQYRAENPDHLHIAAEPDKIQYENAPDRTVYDENGSPVYSRRSLILSGWQLLRIEEQGMESVLFENGDMGLWFDIADLYSENMARLFCMIEDAHDAPGENAWYEEGEFEVGLLEGRFDELPDVQRWVDPAGERTAQGDMLLKETFGNSVLEVRITPILPDEIGRAVLGVEENIRRGDLRERMRNILLISDELRQLWLEEYWADGHLTDTEYAELRQICVHGRAYRVQVFMRIDGENINVTQMLPSLEIRMDVNEDALAEAEEFAAGADDRDAAAQEYLSVHYDMRHGLMGVRNEGAQIEMRDYEPGMAVFGAEALITDGMPDRAEIMAALSARTVDMYGVDVRRSEYAYGKSVGFRYHAAVECRKGVQAAPGPDWQVRWRSDLSGLYLVREIGCGHAAASAAEE